MPSPKICVRFGESLEEALCGLGALREAVVMPLLPAELYAEIPGYRTDFDLGAQTVEHWSPDGLHSLLDESALFRGIALGLDSTQQNPLGYDLVVDAAAPRSQVRVYAQSKSEAMARHLRTIEPNFVGDIPKAEAAWDRTATAAKAMMDALRETNVFRGRPGLGVFPGRDTAPYVRLSKGTQRAAIAYGRKLRGDRRPFLLLGADDRDYAWDALQAALTVSTQTCVVPIDPERLAPTMLVGMIADPDCLGYVGDGYASYAAWALDKPLQIQLVHADPLWNAIRSPRGVVVSTREDLEQKLLPQLDHILDFLFAEH